MSSAIEKARLAAEWGKVKIERYGKRKPAEPREKKPHSAQTVREASHRPRPDFSIHDRELVRARDEEILRLNRQLKGSHEQLENALARVRDLRLDNSILRKLNSK